MDNHSDEGLFFGLADLGFDDLDNISLYNKTEKEKESEKQTNLRQSSPLDFVYERKAECPVCYKQISIPTVKTSGIRILSRDTDFMTYYQEPNPMFYEAWLCKSCGYAALSSRFETITGTQRKLVRDKISSKWKFNKSYPLLFDVETAIEIHQIALLNAVIKMGRDSEKALICLKIAWLYRLKNEPENEKKFLSQALTGFINTYEKESFPIAGMDEATIQYLIGELYRRLGDNSNALLWFGKTLIDRKAKDRIKNMARNQKDRIFKDQKTTK
jgi:uncharacterized protein